jgi:hypothetical protein
MVLLPLAACAPPLQNGDGGNLTILLPGGSAARYGVSREERGNFIYIMDFSGPGGELHHIETSKGEERVTLTLALGDWKVWVEVYHEGTRFGTGEAIFTVYSNRSNNVTIPMSPLPGNEFLSAIDLEDFGGGPAITITRLTAGSPTEWQDALSKIKDNGNYVITLTGNFDLEGISDTDDWSFGSVTGITVSLRGKGEHTISLSLDDETTGSLLRVNNNQTLILRDLTLKGHSENNTSLVYVSGSLTMKAGSKITGNTSSSTNTGGGGVFVYNGSFVMEDGEITGNTSLSTNTGGGGVLVYGGSSTFTMKGGKISGNSAKNGGGGGGGVYVGSAGKVFKTGGIIYGSNAEEGNANVVKDNTASPVDTYGHAVYYYFFGGDSPELIWECYRDTTLNVENDISTATLPTGENWTRK